MGIMLEMRIKRSVLICTVLMLLFGTEARAWQGAQVEGRQAQLIKELHSEDRRVRRHAAEELGRVGGDQAIMALIGALRDQDQFVCSAAALALGEIKDKRASEPLTV